MDTIVKTIAEWVMNEESQPRTILTDEEVIAFNKQYVPPTLPEHNPDEAFKQMLAAVTDALRRIGALPYDSLKTDDASTLDGASGVDAPVEGGAEVCS